LAGGDSESAPMPINVVAVIAFKEVDMIRVSLLKSLASEEIANKRLR
jgi:hypothetical protein